MVLIFPCTSQTESIFAPIYQSAGYVKEFYNKSHSSCVCSKLCLPSMSAAENVCYAVLKPFLLGEKFLKVELHLTKSFKFLLLASYLLPFLGSGWYCAKIIHSRKKIINFYPHFFLKWAIPGLFFIYLRLFKQPSIRFLQQICPSSIRRWDSKVNVNENITKAVFL